MAVAEEVLTLSPLESKTQPSRPWTTKRMTDTFMAMLPRLD